MMKNFDKNSLTAQWYRDLHKNFIKTKPKAIIIISAHWEESTVHITANPQPNLYFDYYGFPAHTYKLTYPAPVDTALAQRIYDILNKNGIKANLDHKRDYDHGVFVPLKVIYPEADIPLVQLSLNKNLDPSYHYKIGQLLEPLRDEGYMVVGSGFATHNLGEVRRSMGSDEGVAPHTKVWIDWLSESLKLSEPEQRKARLDSWSTAPEAKRAHPREEHLIPLHVVAGAADSSRKGAREIYDYAFANCAFNCYLFE